MAAQTGLYPKIIELLNELNIKYDLLVGPAYENLDSNKFGKSLATAYASIKNIEKKHLELMQKSGINIEPTEARGLSRVAESCGIQGGKRKSKKSSNKSSKKGTNKSSKKSSKKGSRKGSRKH